MSDGGDFEQFLRSAKGAGGEPSPDAARRVADALASKIAMNRPLPGPVEDGLRHASSPASALGVRSRAWAKLLGPTLAVGVLAGVTYVTTTTHRPSSQPDATPVQVAPRATSASSAGPSENTAPLEAPKPADSNLLVIDDPAKLPSATPPAAAPPSSAAKTTGTAKSLDAELRLLAKTNEALRAGNAAQALALVNSHDKDFPDGALGPEFASQRVRCLAALGRRAEACQEARRFLAQNPNSPLALQVRSTCDDTNSSP